MTQKDRWPNNHDWDCDCNQCEESWSEIDDIKEDIVKSEEIDEELQKEMDELFGFNGYD